MVGLSALTLNTSWSISEDLQIRIARYFMPFYLMNMALSTFVNSVIIVVTIRCKAMRHISNILIAAQAAGDMIITWEVPVFVYHTMTRQLISCRLCFFYQLFPILAVNLTTIAILLLGVDRLINLTRPTWYLQLNKKFYILTLLLVFVAYIGPMTGLVFMTTTDTKGLCFISDAFAGLGKDVWTVSQCFINVAVIVVYKKAKKAVRAQTMIRDKISHRIFQSLYLIMVFYIGGWVTTVVLLLAVRVLISDPGLTEIVELGVAVFAASNLCIPFFVYYHRSPLYRREIQRLLGLNERIAPFLTAGSTPMPQIVVTLG